MSPAVPGFSALKARQLRALLERELGYAVVRQSGGSHKRLESSSGYPPLTLAFHDGQTIGPHLVRDILVKQVGLTITSAREVARRA